MKKCVLRRLYHSKKYLFKLIQRNIYLNLYSKIFWWCMVLRHTSYHKNKLRGRIDVGSLYGSRGGGGEGSLDIFPTSQMSKLSKE